MGDMPFVPPTIGAMLIKRTYLPFSPIHKATLFTPDILDEPTPIVPLSATNKIFYLGATRNSSKSFASFIMIKY